MRSRSYTDGCDQAARVSLYALRALPSGEAETLEPHIAACAECRQQMERLRPVIDSLAAWPMDVLRPSESLWERLAQRILPDSDRARVMPVPATTPAAAGVAAAAAAPTAAPAAAPEPQWKEVAPGISCKLLATDTEHDRVSMLVRLAPGVYYPPHRHAGVEELHLLHGQLWIDNRRLFPGDYNRAEPGSADARVWSETGCTCVLVTSSLDVIF